MKVITVQNADGNWYTFLRYGGGESIVVSPSYYDRESAESHTRRLSIILKAELLPTITSPWDLN